jgi:hypothetical protein
MGQVLALILGKKPRTVEERLDRLEDETEVQRESLREVIEELRQLRMRMERKAEHRKRTSLSMEKCHGGNGSGS